MAVRIVAHTGSAVTSYDAYLADEESVTGHPVVKAACLHQQVSETSGKEGTRSRSLVFGYRTMSR